MLLVFLLGCAPGEPGLLLTGWEYEWAELSHRVSYVRVGVEPDSSLLLGLVGGDWSTGTTYTDTPKYRVRYARVTDPTLSLAYARATLDVGPEGVASMELEVDATALPAGRTLTALIHGFTIDTDTAQPDGYPADYDPAYGYTSRGFGFALGEPTREGDTARVPVEAAVRWGPQDREDVNAAIPYAVTTVTVDVAVIASPGEVESYPISGSRAHDPVHGSATDGDRGRVRRRRGGGVLPERRRPPGSPAAVGGRRRGNYFPTNSDST